MMWTLLDEELSYGAQSKNEDCLLLLLWLSDRELGVTQLDLAKLTRLRGQLKNLARNSVMRLW